MTVEMERHANEMARLARLLNQTDGRLDPSTQNSLIALLFQASLAYLDAQSEAFKEGLKREVS